MATEQELIRRAGQYAQRYGLMLREQLGYGIHGIVFVAESQTEWRADKQEQFGDRWPEVELILASLERYGIFLADVSPSNIALPP